MKVLTLAASTALVALGASACSENAVSPRIPVASASSASQQAIPKGSGITLDIVPNVTLPILGSTNSVTISQAVVTNFALVENTVGQIIGLQVTGTLTGTEVDALGKTISAVVDPFVANVSVTSSGPGQCNLVTLDLSGIDINALGLLTGHVPVNITAKGSGAIGSLLCNLGNLLSGLTSGLTGSPGAQGVVNALNNHIGG